MTIDTATVRSDLCGDSPLVHFNNAGASLMPAPVLATQINHLTLEAKIGGYEAARDQKKQIEDVYQSIATLLNCQASEIALLENATAGWLAAFHSIDFKAGDRILTSRAEYASNYLSFLQLKQQKGVVIDIIPCNATGEASPQALLEMLDDKVKLIAITHIPTNGGLINPAQEIGEIANANGILYLLDACQSAGQIPLDVNLLKCDFLSATGRKYLRGPRGSGFLYIKQQLIPQLKPSVIDLHAATWLSENNYQLQPTAKRFENWEFNYASVLGLGAAVDYALDIGITNIAQYNIALAASLRAQLALIEGIEVADIGASQCGIVTFYHQNIEASEIIEAMTAQGINLSCSKPSSTLLDATARALPNLVRASVHYFNTESELSFFIRQLKRLLTAT